MSTQLLKTGMSLNPQLKGLYVYFKWPLVQRWQLTDSQRMSIKAFSDQVWIKFLCFCLKNCLFPFLGSLQKWIAHFLLTRKTGKIIRIRHFSSWVNRARISLKLLRTVHLNNNVSSQQRNKIFRLICFNSFRAFKCFKTIGQL